jgi:cytoskeleton protein RodZ
MVILESSCKGLKVLFAICKDIWCFNMIYTLRGRALTLRQKIVNAPLDSTDGFKQIGLTLKSARRSEGRSVQEVSEQLCISVDYLTKLEAGAFEELPAPAYVMGFLRSYGHSVGLVPDSLVARYMALTASEDTKPSYKIPMSTRPPQRSAPAAASIIVLCAGIAYGGWFWLKTDSLSVLDANKTTSKTAMVLLNQESIAFDVGSLDTPAAIDLEVNKVAMPAATPTTDLVPELASIQTIAVEPTAPKIVGDELANIDSTSAQNIVTGAGNKDAAVVDAQMPAPANVVISDLVLVGELAETQILTSPDSNPADLRKSNTAIANLRDPAKEITIRAVAASWVEIVRDNGEEVMAKLMQAGDSYVVEGNTRLYLSTGNAGGLMVVIGADDPLSMGGIGEIVRDLPLVTEKLRKAL